MSNKCTTETSVIESRGPVSLGEVSANAAQCNHLHRTNLIDRPRVPLGPRKSRSMVDVRDQPVINTPIVRRRIPSIAEVENLTTTATPTSMNSEIVSVPHSLPAAIQLLRGLWRRRRQIPERPDRESTYANTRERQESAVHGRSLFRRLKESFTGKSATKRTSHQRK